jgi:thioredoxin-related protein
MKQKLLLIFFLCISFFCGAFENTGSSEAKDWLNIIDAGKYIKKWEKQPLVQTTAYRRKMGEGTKRYSYTIR